MSLLSRIIGVFRAKPPLEAPAILPDGKLQIHLLSGTFDSEKAAHDYCFAAIGDAPEQLTFEQPDAFIDTGFVEAVYQGAPDRLSEFLSPKAVQRILGQMAGDNTLVIISEDAFAGQPYALVSNDTLRYLGPIIVDG